MNWNKARKQKMRVGEKLMAKKKKYESKKEWANTELEFSPRAKGEWMSKNKYERLLASADKLAVTLHMACVENEKVSDIEAMKIIDAYYEVRGEP